ncbi:hypothetical protein CQA53_10945 [Helicobacter didelphidarum]|uniref:Uncharacterized protein n=1 Tax=Helicobacter didelphidarum TaxID=2040648 RepID=A0A3D8I5G5_9HELI|nr:hypothetical protein [Helicobacter didelphidarum]RDU60382.1 hypothetical protein CQA53_10945 [Helicobacter didelphidarum]
MTKENLLLKLKEIFTIKRILISLVSLFFILFFVGGCSFRLMDWQYYKFVKLCKKPNKAIIYNKNIYDLYIKADKQINFYQGEKFYDKNTNQTFYVDSFLLKGRYVNEISSSLSESRNIVYYNKQPFYEYSSYWYKETGLFLSGDEGAGFIWKNNRTLYCKENIIEVRR